MIAFVLWYSRHFPHKDSRGFDWLSDAGRAVVDYLPTVERVCRSMIRRLAGPSPNPATHNSERLAPIFCNWPATKTREHAGQWRADRLRQSTSLWPAHSLVQPIKKWLANWLGIVWESMVRGPQRFDKSYTRLSLFAFLSHYGFNPMELVIISRTFRRGW